MFRYFVGSNNRVAYCSYPGSALIGGSIQGRFGLYHFNHTELLLAVL